MKSNIIVLLTALLFTISISAQVDVVDNKVGLNTLDPQHDIHMKGSELLFQDKSTLEIKMYMGTDGKLGIGTMAPTGQLHTKGIGYINNTIEGSTAADLILTKTSGNKMVQRYDGLKTNFLSLDNSNGVINSTILTLMNEGNVGIGTNSPNSKLDVAGDGNFRGSQLRLRGPDIPRMIVQSNIATATNAEAYYYAGSDGASSNTDLNRAYRFGYNKSAFTIDYIPGSGLTGTPNRRFVINSIGNVGIGNIVPTAKLDVDGKTKTTNLQLTTDAGAGKVLQSDTDGNASWVDPSSLAVTGDDMGDHTATQNINLNGKWLSGDGGNEGIIINNEGHVGIGNPAPLYELEIGNTIEASSVLQLQTSATGVGSLYFADQTNARGRVDYYHDSDYFRWVVGSSPKMYLNSIGLGLGDPTPSNRLDVQGAVRIGSAYNNVTAPIDGLLIAGNVGIGTTTPTTKLDVAGKTKTTNLQVTTDAGAGKVLQSDAEGNASWVAPSSFTQNLYSDDGTLPSNRTITTNGKYLRLLSNNTDADNLIFKNEGVSAGYSNQTSMSQKGSNGHGVNGWSNAFVTESTSEGGLVFSSFDGPINFQTDRRDMRMSILENGNVGIGTTSPTQKLDVTGNIRASSNLYADGRYLNLGLNQIYGNNSTALYIDNAHSTVSQIILRDKENTTYGRLRGDGNGNNFGLMDGDGHWSLLAAKDNYTSFRINNSEKMRILNTGNVGIGTTEPRGKLHIKSDWNATTGSSGLELEGDKPSIRFKSLMGANQDSEFLMHIGEHGEGGGLSFYSGSTESWNHRMVIEEEGHVGIGTHNPYHNLDLGSSLGKKLALYQNSQGGDFYGFGISPSTMELYASGDSSAEPKMVIKSYGSVGIGTEEPETNLHLQHAQSAILKLEADTDNTVETDHPQIQLSQDGGSVTGLVGFYGGTNHLKISNNWNSADADIEFQTGTTTKMTIDGTGNVGIGTTDPQTALHAKNSFQTQGKFEGTTGNRGGINIKSEGSAGGFKIQQAPEGTAVIENYGDNGITYYAKRHGGHYFHIRDTNKRVFSLNNDGSVRLHDYTTNNHNGSPTHMLGVDASGNVVKISNSQLASNMGSVWAAPQEINFNQLYTATTNTFITGTMNTCSNYTCVMTLKINGTAIAVDGHYGGKYSNVAYTVPAGSTYEISVSSGATGYAYAMNTGGTTSSLASNPTNTKTNQSSEKIEALTQEVETLKILVEALLEEKVAGINRVEVTLENAVELETPYLSQNIPNPTSNDAIIKYYVPEDASEAMIRFYSLSGQVLKEVNINQMGQGELKVDLQKMISGNYIYNLIVDGEMIDTKTMVIVK